MKRLLALALIIAAAHAHAASVDVVDTAKHDLPTHKLQWSDSLDVVEDREHGVVCYVARASDSHAMQMQCLRTK
jgi:catabolite regulation protein CreA